MTSLTSLQNAVCENIITKSGSIQEPQLFLNDVNMAYLMVYLTKILNNASHSSFEMMSCDRSLWVDTSTELHLMETITPFS